MEIKTNLNARLAIRQRADIFRANISANKISLHQGQKKKLLYHLFWSYNNFTCTSSATESVLTCFLERSEVSWVIVRPRGKTYFSPPILKSYLKIPFRRDKLTSRILRRSSSFPRLCREKKNGLVASLRSLR